MTSRMVNNLSPFIFFVERSANLRFNSIVKVGLWRKNKRKEKRKNICNWATKCVFNCNLMSSYKFHFDQRQPLSFLSSKHLIFWSNYHKSSKKQQMLHVRNSSLNTRFIGPRPTESPIKSTFSVCPSVRSAFFLEMAIFLRNCSLVFSNFWQDGN